MVRLTSSEPLGIAAAAGVVAEPAEVLLSLPQPDSETAIARVEHERASSLFIVMKSLKLRKKAKGLQVAAFPSDAVLPAAAGGSGSNMPENAARIIESGV